MPTGFPKGRSVKKYDFLGGGLVTRPDDRYTNLLNDKGHFYSPSETNVQFTKIGSIQKRLGYAQVGSDVQNGLLYSQTTRTNNVANPTAVDGQTTVLLKKITASSSTSIVSAVIALRIAGLSGVALRGQYFKNIYCKIYSDVAGVPTAILGTSNVLTDGLETAASTSQAPTTFYFTSPVPVTSGSDYWIWVQATPAPGTSAIGSTFNINWLGATAASGTSYYSLDGGTTLVATTIDPYLYLYASTKAVLGLYDYRPQAAGVITQFVMTAVNGTLYYETGGAYTSIKTGLASSANSLYDFSTLKNYLFSCDYATSNNQCWDGAASATMTHGYRGTFTGGTSNSAGGPWSGSGATAKVKVMLVTQLRSGGYRASAIYEATLANTTQKIDLTSIAVDAIAAQFSFDIASAATTVLCTLPGGSIFYVVPAIYLSTATSNPIPNTQTSNSILPMTDAQLTTPVVTAASPNGGKSFEAAFGYPQGYATGQVDTPKAKYMQVFQDMLATAGDPNNPSRVWFSEQYAPQVWGNGDSGTGIQGDYLDIAVDDGETVTGLAVSDGALLVGKQTNIYRVDFTGNASDSWIVRKVHGQVGVLSNWSMQVIPEGLFFLSNRGPAICYGTYSDVLPQTRLIQNLFDNTSAESFDLSSMIYTVACNDTTRNQVLMTISSPGVTIRDRVLSYDYEQKMFGLYDGYQANYLAVIGDSNGFPVLWNGNLSGQVFKRSLITDATPYFDNGAPIIVSYSTPNLDFGDPATWAQADFLHINGKVQSSGNLYVDLLANNSTTSYRTFAVDQTQAKFSIGVPIRLGAVMQNLKIRFRSVDFTGVSGMELHWLRLEFSESSGTRMG